MKILCAHHKGGVGKTAAAIHATGVLNGEGERVLLIDADSQNDSYRFFSKGDSPTRPGDELEVDDLLTVVSARAEDLDALVRRPGFDHVVVDVKPDLREITPVLVAAAPDLALVGVRKDDYGSFTHLDDMLEALRQARSLGVRPRIKVVPIGVEEAEFAEYVDAPDIAYEVADPILWRPTEAGTGMYRAYEYLWEYDGCGDAYAQYQSVVLD